jgi:hypothetical protein
MEILAIVLLPPTGPARRPGPAWDQSSFCVSRRQRPAMNFTSSANAAIKLGNPHSSQAFVARQRSPLPMLGPVFFKTANPLHISVCNFR